MPDRPPTTWLEKFHRAFRGVQLGVRGQNSFLVQIPVAILVVLLAAVLRVSLVEWGLLILCIGIVLASELLNSALESLARAVDESHNEHIGAALDIAAGAVLVASLSAASVGGLVFIYRLGILLAWWA